MTQRTAGADGREATAPHTTLAERRRVVAATTIGTAIEWYDFFLYASVAGLVFNQLMFGPLGSGAATIVSFLTVGLSFLFRPLGAFLAGHFADRVGRRLVLMVTLFTMGAATALIGLLPTYDSIGVWAPVLLIVLRILQGVSAGGEWGSAVLLAVEHAPVHKRGLFGAGPQIGVPAGLLLSSGVLALMNVIAPGDAFMEWGWRIPFLFSILLVIVGFYIRRGVDESPVFEEISQRAEAGATNPVGSLFRRYLPLVIVGALVFAGNGTVGYMTTGGFIQNHATDPDGLAMERGAVLLAVTGSAATWMLFTLVAGWVSDHLGRRRTYIIGFLVQAVGAAALFPLVGTGNIWILFGVLVFLTVGLGLTYGQQSAMYAELFPASIRGSGVSITYAIGSILGGAFAPTIAAALVQGTGGTAAVTGYLVTATLVGLVAVLLLKDRTGIALGPDNEAEQATGHFVLGRSRDAT
jgi:MFS family permease